MSCGNSSVIRLKGVRHNNLKGFDLDIPIGKLTVVTGLSGSGKSSLAFDTLFAEGQRRYIETFSPYARQFFDRMDKPQVDSIEGIPPAIAIEQRNAVKTTRSTVGTMTETCDYMKVVWAHCSTLYCPGCDEQVRKDSPQSIWKQFSDLVKKSDGTSQALITFDLELTEKLSMEEMLSLIQKQGYQRVLAPTEKAKRSSGALKELAAGYQTSGDYTVRPIRVDEATEIFVTSKTKKVSVIQDRVKLTASNRARFVEACEQAYHFGKGHLSIHLPGEYEPRRFSKGFHCAPCNKDFREATPSLFSFNHPSGACPDCRGFGRIITIDYDLSLPDRTRTLKDAIKPWQSGHGEDCQKDLVKTCKEFDIPMDVPFNKLSKKHQEWVIQGDPMHGKTKKHRWPHNWYGLKGYFDWLESKSYKMHVRVLLSRYRAYVKCGNCQGQRFQPETLNFRITPPKSSAAARRYSSMTLANFYDLPVSEASELIKSLSKSMKFTPTDPLKVVFGEVASRLAYLDEVGLGYLTINRPTRSLSGGETERVNLTSCLGSRLVNTLFVLDEPSVGLHARDTQRLVTILHRLRDAGNTVVVVEHEQGVMEAADNIVDLGPLQGDAGGEIIFEGTLKALKKSDSLTGQYLSGRKILDKHPKRKVTEKGKHGWLKLEHISKHNLDDVAINIPLSRLVSISGVSGSGKTTLIKKGLLPLLQEKLGGDIARSKDDDEGSCITNTKATITGWKKLGRVQLVDQSSLGKTPRSNPAVYTGAFDFIRDLFSRTPLAKQRGLNTSAFSFNSAQGQCETCKGVGFEKIEMQFLSDVFIKCNDCDGRRYRPHILEVKLSPEILNNSELDPDLPGMSVADMLESTVNDVCTFLEGFGENRKAERAIQSLDYLRETGLGYLRLGQPINTLSGGECQRLKLSRHLAEFSRKEASEAKSTLFLFDEPTTGLHFDDVRVLVNVFQKLVNLGHTVIVIEHNLDVLHASDWLIDLGPDGGEEGGEVVAVGAPKDVAKTKTQTGKALAGS
ncbi:excinuclease ABC subunit UvrA [Verrucomicrobia bacterium]|nr:excinuclease ABC subunit UvrA [Verrucomicrobiota bacterium]